MPQSIKPLILKAFHEAGLLRLLIASQRSKVTILMLHGVIDPNVPTAWKPLRSYLSTEQLAHGLNILAPYYHFVSLSDAAEMLAGNRPLIPNSLALTFDDGYRNNIIYALPILRQFKAPATIFLSTGNVTEQKPFWFDRLDYAVQSINNTTSCDGIPELTEIDFSTGETLSSSFITFLRKEKLRHPTSLAMRTAITNLTKRIEQHSGHGLAEIFADDSYSGILTWNEVRQAASEVHFGSHSVNHFQLDLLPPEAAKQELIASREMIEFHTGLPCTHLAYPNGSFNDNVLSLVRDCNYCSAVTTSPGLNQRGDDLLLLRRFSFPYTYSAAGIIAAVSGLSSQWQKIGKSFL
jgi:peptidoglycan/xylan/chitin deacetylase (PgdA/CDA1 family)